MTSDEWAAWRILTGEHKCITGGCQHIARRKTRAVDIDAGFFCVCCLADQKDVFNAADSTTGCYGEALGNGEAEVSKRPV